MIKPTVGRRVWLWLGPHNDNAQPYDAGVAHVNKDGTINISYADEFGVMHAASSVKLLQEGDKAPPSGMYCEWMPYQQNKAKDELGVFGKAAKAVPVTPQPVATPAAQATPTGDKK